jgi:diguanylate cyclase (GGDEF)-like protein/PAS domain S-box-containing protein
MVDALLHRRAAREDARFRRFADATFEGLFFMRNGTVTDVNAVLCRMLGRSPAEVVGAPLWSFFAPSRRAALEALTSGGIEVEMIDDLGGALVVDLLARPLSEGEDAEIVVAVRDASERKRAERRIQELVHIDPLTGLANRLLMRDRLAQALAMAERAGSQVAVLCLDLDKFKAVNDVMGHHAGDALLAEAANRLRAETRDTDTIARLGGDEFLVIQPFEGEPTSARLLAQRLVQVLSAPFLIEGAPIHVGASIGVALYPNDAAAPEMLLKLADLALYRAKHDGRCCWRFFEKSMDTKLRARREMEQDLRQAIARRELSLCYQPVFSAKGLVLTGYEALLRWTHPVRGAIRPDVFIPLAEECGMIAAIGRWVLETACAEAASWPERHSIAVNLSPAQFDDADFAAQVTTIMAKAGLAPERLELEVTEGLLIKDSDAALRILAALKAQGIRIALDDFGTGYSSLSYLRRFEFDRLKIDRSFIAELGTNDEADALVRTILAMSRSLHLDVTAEGVETERQLSILQELRCDSVQGYLLGRPQPTVLSVNAGGTACLVQ